MTDELLVERIPEWHKAYRLVNSAFPPISVFEDTLDPGDLELAYAIEAMTNDRLRDQAGEITRVAAEDRVSGAGATVVMAVFTHIGRASRFSDGSFGVYYCANSVDAAIAETRYHQERFWRATQEASIEITMRAYEWVHKANSAAPFNGRSALEYMLGGQVVDVADVRRYLDGVRG